MKNGETKSALLEARTKALALRVIKLYSALPKAVPAQVIGRQLLRCGTSVGAQYREVIRARSRAEFLSKLRSALQELEETSYWLDLIVEAELLPASRITALRAEVRELTAMFVASINTARQAAS
jgi:four helix bundle protein